MNGPELLTLPELVKLIKEETLELPNIQRGFVWKPCQIEDLWDSILRGFPAGSIIVDKTIEGKLKILDGQQRTTSIALGFSDTDTAILKSSTSHIRIFIDMEKPDVEKTGRHFIVRVITRSHPWGYKKNDNTKTISATDRSEAMDFWNISDDIFKHPIDEFFPWDAYAPLPLNIFINSVLCNDTVDILKKKLIDWVNERKPADKNKINETTVCHWLHYLRAEENSENDNSDTYSINDIYINIKRIIDTYRVPMLPLDLEYVTSDISKNKNESKNEGKTKDNETDDDTVKNDINDDIEEVFVRLNTKGIPLGGEELNYTIIKFYIKSELQEELEEACKGIMKPARFIRLVYPLFQNCKTENKNSIDVRANPKQFQRDMKDCSEKFDIFLKDILNEGLLKKIKNILKYGENGIDGYKSSIEKDYRLPYPLFVKIADKAPEAMFILMYRIYKKKDTFDYDDDIHRKMIGIMLLFMWHGCDIAKIWEAVKILPKEKMWSNVIVDFAFGEELKIPGNNKFLNKIKKPERTNIDIWKNLTDQENSFYDNVMCNRDVLLFAQRKFIADSDFFPDTLFELDDTNMPFDYDHISPQNYVKSKKYTPPRPLKDIYFYPCNIRIWPYSLNRSDSDDVPKNKFNIKKKTEQQRNFLKNIKQFKGKDDNEINQLLYEYSFCDESWSQFGENWLNGQSIKKERWGKIYNLLWKRWKNIFDDLSSELCFKDLAASPEDKINNWREVIKVKSYWTSFWSEYSDNFHQLPIDSKLYFYLCTNNDDDMEIQFGIYGDDEELSEYSGNYSCGKSISPKENEGKKYWIWKETRLSYPYKEGYKQLYRKIKKWLKGLKFKSIGDKAIEKLEKSIRQEFID